MRLVTGSTTGLAAEIGPPRPGRLPRRIWLVALATALLQLAVAVPFMQVQCIWSDETTQVAGLTLSPVEVTRWLAGEDPQRFGVPGDRMPPLSYWVGWVWSLAFGSTERSLRWMGLALTSGGTACVALAAGRLAGGRAALIASLLYALSPNVVTCAPEIRAYPLFIALAAASFLSLIGYAQAKRENETRWLIACLACTLAATYSHFFGLVLGGAIFTSATLVALAGRRRVVPPILGGIGLVLLSAGILPFARASTAISTEVRSETTADSLRAFGRLVYRLIGHPAASVDLPILGLLLVGMVGLVGIGLWPRTAGSSQETEPRPPGRGPWGRVRLDLMAIPLALVAGLSVTLVAGFVIRTFFVLQLSYSSWVIPGLFIVAGCAFAPGSGRRLTAAAGVLATLALVAETWSVGTIIAHGENFTHGPRNAIERLIESAGGDQPPIVVHETGPCWAFIYFPIRLAHGPGFEQYLAPESGEGPPQRWPLKPLAGATRPTSLEELPRDRKVLVLLGSTMGQDAIRREIRGGGQVVPDGTLIEALARDPSWVVERELRYLAYTSVQGRLYAPRTVPARPEPTLPRGETEPGQPASLATSPEPRP